MIANSMKPFLAGSSVIRAMFEEGKKMAKVYGEENVYDFSVGNPGLHPPKEVHDAIEYINNEMDPHVVHGYMANAGYESTRKAVAENLNRRFGKGKEIYSWEHIIMTVGAGSAINDIMKTVFDPGDKQVVFAPYFVEYANWARNYLADTIVVPPNEANGFEPDPEALKEALTPEVKLVIINNPNNPTGAIYSAETIQKIAEVLKEKEKEYGHTIYILSDEPYRELVYVDKEVPFIPDYYDDTIMAYSWSKSLSLPGERIGYVAVPDKAEGADEFIQAAIVANRVCGDTNAPGIMQLVVERCMDARVDIPYYEKNAKDLYDIVTKAGFKAIVPQGAFYLWIKSPVEDEKEFVSAAKDERILIVPGSAFACPGYVRASFCIANETIQRSAESFANLGKKYFG
ncbi:pyridoxal phosphate-dependent aminotransferase [Baileyella intestinalis]|uniref:pyridoxal phosphate-dependent aminotransferase n=1 Tax=Baileyella intestinalis TaxID=2606709 RepID=UPI0022E51570|nr:pyridoxal phosphate-dependent aminotransferase [Baileyella intestinalis]